MRPWLIAGKGKPGTPQVQCAPPSWPEKGTNVLGRDFPVTQKCWDAFSRTQFVCRDGPGRQARRPGTGPGLVQGGYQTSKPMVENYPTLRHHVGGLGGPRRVPAHPILKIGAPKIAQAALRGVCPRTPWRKQKMSAVTNPAH